jgi:hypothetical protein
VDRVDRKRLMIATDLARAAVIATISLLAAVDALSVGWVYAVAFSSATLTIAFDAAEFAAPAGRQRQPRGPAVCGRQRRGGAAVAGCRAGTAAAVVQPRRPRRAVGRRAAHRGAGGDPLGHADRYLPAAQHEHTDRS